MRILGIFLLVVSAASGQNEPPPATMANNGQPISLPFRCTDEDMEWAGLSCSEQEPCPIYLEVTAAEPLGNKIFAIGNLHSETVTLYSVLLVSDDSGASWREGFERIRGAGLDHIQFLDLANGWISGESLSPLPQDAFLLLTSDGGVTWSRQPLFSDPEPGSVQEFLFTSKDNGSLIIDRGEGSEEERYAQYDSPDGGRSWSIKELSNRPLHLARVQPERDWRVRIDRATRAYRIERRQGERWIPAASFAVSAGVCKPLP